MMKSHSGLTTYRVSSLRSTTFDGCSGPVPLYRDIDPDGLFSHYEVIDIESNASISM
ncbi:hypothetical protein VAT7223_00819 [Vibrio atlanticus]|uniref:Uncharacterized protein n=1 Tax=Vibrio atlanticus TaxID=693153 RepID=A0A1C3IK63_9VIBR|nr:hypothetical protein VAT7223_00819 [Vibrio atlanticus]